MPTALQGKKSYAACSRSTRSCSLFQSSFEVIQFGASLHSPPTFVRTINAPTPSRPIHVERRDDVQADRDASLEHRCGARLKMNRPCLSSLHLCFPANACFAKDARSAYRFPLSHTLKLLSPMTSAPVAMTGWSVERFLLKNSFVCERIFFRIPSGPSARGEITSVTETLSGA